MGWTKLNVDGAAKGKLGPAGGQEGAARRRRELDCGLLFQFGSFSSMKAELLALSGTLGSLELRG